MGYIYGVRGWFEKKFKNWLVGQVYILGAGKRGDGELGGVRLGRGGVPYWLRGGSQKDAGGGRRVASGCMGLQTFIA